MVFFETVLRRNNAISPLAVLLSFPRFQEWSALLADSAEACQYYFEFFHRGIVLRAMFQRDGFSANAGITLPAATAISYRTIGY